MAEIVWACPVCHEPLQVTRQWLRCERCACAWTRAQVLADRQPRPPVTAAPGACQGCGGGTVVERDGDRVCGRCGSPLPEVAPRRIA